MERATYDEYLANHSFAVAFTIFAAASQGLGGLLAVLGMGEYGASVAHLMSFSTGVMVYLSFMDIMFDTTAKIGEYWSSLAFFAGLGLFLLLEVSLPEVEGAEVAELFGVAWSPSSLEDADGPVSCMADTSTEGPQPAGAVDGGLRRRTRSGGSQPERGSPLRHAASPEARAIAADDGSRASEPSPPPSARRRAFASEGEQAISDKRKGRVAFSGLMVMVSISLHNIPEGIAVYLTCLKGVKSGLPLAIAMSLHNIPEGMAVAGPLYAATKSKSKAVLAATISGGFEVVG